MSTASPHLKGKHCAVCIVAIGGGHLPLERRLELVFCDAGWGASVLMSRVLHVRAVRGVLSGGSALLRPGPELGGWH